MYKLKHTISSQEPEICRGSQEASHKALIESLGSDIPRALAKMFSKFKKCFRKANKFSKFRGMHIFCGSGGPCFFNSFFTENTENYCLDCSVGKIESKYKKSLRKIKKSDEKVIPSSQFYVKFLRDNLA